MISGLVIAVALGFSAQAAAGTGVDAIVGKPTGSSLGRAQALYAKGLEARENDQLNRALALFSDCITEEAGFRQCYSEKAVVLMALGHNEPAFLYYQLYTQVAPGTAPRQELRHIANTYSEGLSGKETRKAARALYARGSEALQRGQAGYAVLLLADCIKTDPGYALCYRDSAVAYQRLGQSADAYLYYYLYLTVDPEARDAEEVRRSIRQYKDRRATRGVWRRTASM